MKKTDSQTFLEQSISKVLQALEIDAVITVETVDGEDRNYFNVHLEVEEGSPELIGRYGSMLESLANVLNAMLATKAGDDPEDQWRVIVDVNNYRRDRTEYIEEVAQRAIDEAKLDQKSVRLNPMKPWERRVVHMVVAKDPEVVTESDGEGFERHVVISPAN